MRAISILLIAFAALAGGCTTPVYTTSYATPEPAVATTPSMTVARSDLDVSRKQLKGLEDRLGRTSSPAEGEVLRGEIEALKKRIEELEEQIGQAPSQVSPAAYQVTPARSYGASPVYTGPRGGRYTIGPSGKKSYIRRK